MSQWCFNNSDFATDKKFGCTNNKRLVDAIERVLEYVNNCIASTPDQLSSIQRLCYFIITELVYETMESLSALHRQNILHSNLKPGNILIKRYISGRFIKLADFGRSTEYQEHTMVSRTTSVGSPVNRYIAPEILKFDRYGSKADVFSLGMVVTDIFDLDKHK
ncbi:unnamed protein product [Medioppia subpectinata]|uniref:Protein kinase domain-containing protein n=1 Tax=Medioppia subpectinata TaxID=1979941 RepID=A0A7R9KHT2_9ACAR|nr:unnamed protein product [Medioppia subpectinata]CAG2103653.1 unnamed protein product [Medioppia subpectinata]